MRKLLERKIPVYALLAVIVLQTTVVYGAVLPSEKRVGGAP